MTEILQNWDTYVDKAPYLVVLLKTIAIKQVWINCVGYVVNLLQ